MHKKQTLKYILVSIITLSLLGIWLKSEKTTLLLTNNEDKIMSKTMNDLSSRCIGQYLIDFPSDFKLINGLVSVNDKQVESQKIFLPAFEHKISLREKELRHSKPIKPANIPFLKNVYPLPSPMVGVIFEYISSESAPDAFRILEGHVYNNGVAFKTTIDAVNADGDRYQSERSTDPDVYYNDVESKVASLVQLLGKFQGRDETEMPSSKGTCIPNGLILALDNKKEEVKFSYQSTNNKHVYLNFESDNFLQEDSSMLERSAFNSELFSENKTRTITKGPRDINGLKVEEWLTVGNGVEAVNGHNFVLKVNEKSGSPKTPFLTVNLIHGPLPDENLSEEEILHEWQEITTTLRVRPKAI